MTKLESLIMTNDIFVQECLDSVGPFWSASDQARVGLAEDMQVFLLNR